MRHPRWACVLAGGNGTRLANFISSVYQDGRPKQFCTLYGNRTMLEQTLDRAHAIVPPEQVVVSLQRAHQRWYHPMRGGAVAHFSIQPRNAGTGAALLLSLFDISRYDPTATIIMFPSDHYVADIYRFIQYVEQAADWVEDNPKNIAVLGVEAEYPESEYGWLLPVEGDTKPAQLHAVNLYEKPGQKLALDLLRRGAYWNTMIHIFRCDTMLRLIRRTAPAWHEAIAQVHYAGWRELEAAYRMLPNLDFSRDIIQKQPDILYLQKAHGIGWSDWGNEARIRRATMRETSLPQPLQRMLTEA